MDFIKQSWELIKETLKKEYSLSEISYSTWVAPLKCYEVKDDVVVILIPSDQAHALNYINNKYKSYFQVTISEMMDHTYDISFILEKDTLNKEETTQKTSLKSNPALVKISSITLTILQIIILLFSLAISASSFLSVSNNINSSLTNMENFSTEIAQGNLSARINSPDILELNPLAKNMNTMASQIDLLIKKNIEEEKNFQKAEMKALQAQITPHFLYNTLDTILWLAEEEQTEDVVKITKAFSDFLRISLSRGHEWITIQQEIDHIKNYLTIQKIRYADVLNYKIEVNEDLLNFKTIKLVLQPLVENAIYHGIKNKRGRGNLFVNVEFFDESKNSIIFTVQDDGAGFTEERLKEVSTELQNASTDSEKLNSVYGLYNVNKKLKLYYGEKTNGLEIKSEHKKGTSISFIIPCQTEADESGVENV